MSPTTQPPPRRHAGLAAWTRRDRLAGLAFQALLLVALVWGLAALAGNAVANLERQGIASGFDFLGRTAGFDISQVLIDYKNTDTYGRAFLVGLLNTLLVAGLGIVIATVIGFLVGIARLSPNWLVAGLGTSFVEIVRNVPLLLQLFIWYFAVLKNLPAPRQSIALPLGALINVRGLYLPRAVWGEGAGLVLAAAGIGLLAAVVLVARAARQRRATGTAPRVAPLAVLLGIGLPLVAYLVAGQPLSFTKPELKGFNVAGGLAVQPEFVALLAGLSVYTAAFIAEVVRAGIAGVPKGQTEAASALGLDRAQTLRLVVIPQALRIIIPPLTNQYLNLTKNSSLAVAIGYPDLVSVFAGTVLHQTNQAIEVIAITMAVYLALSLLTALVMGMFNARYALART